MAGRDEIPEKTQNPSKSETLNLPKVSSEEKPFFARTRFVENGFHYISARPRGQISLTHTGNQLVINRYPDKGSSHYV